jgi:hypothetical protein
MFGQQLPNGSDNTTLGSTPSTAAPAGARRYAIIAGGLAVTAALLGSLAGLGPANAASKTATGAGALSSAPQPSISSVSFSGTSGSGVASPTITITGSHFGSSAPAGTSDDSTSCGPYTANGDVYGNKLYFVDDTNFEAGYSNSSGATCVGIIVDSWSATQVVLQFGNAYGTFDHWYLSNGDGYAISLKNGLWGGTVSGLS